VTNRAKVNTQRSYADVAAALAAAQAELQRLRASSSSSSAAAAAAVAAAETTSPRAAAAESEGEVREATQRDVLPSARSFASQDELAECKADLAKCVLMRSYFPRVHATEFFV
jgi:septal ring factor EnvC (AmiA/AmiB activator)